MREIKIQDNRTIPGAFRLVLQMAVFSVHLPINIFGKREKKVNFVSDISTHTGSDSFS